jgi:hypothetical protein
MTSKASTRQAISQDRIRYCFDSRGFYHHRRFLDSNQLAALRVNFDRLPFVADSWAPHQRRSAGIGDRDDIFGKLGGELLHHAITLDLVGYPPRLIESYALQRLRGALDLHGGASEFLLGTERQDISSMSFVRNEQVYTLRLKVLLYLDDILSTRDGFFCYIEGSHKAAFSFHRSFPEGRRGIGEMVRTVALARGDAIWLNESLLHGAEIKVSKKPRRVLAYTYSPAFMSDWRELTKSDGPGYYGTETEGEDGR